MKQVVYLKVGLFETPRRFSRKLCLYYSIAKFEDEFDTALHFLHTRQLNVPGEMAKWA